MSFHSQGRSSFICRRMILQQQQGLKRKSPKRFCILTNVLIGETAQLPNLGLIIYRLLIRASDRLLCILTFKRHLQNPGGATSSLPVQRQIAGNEDVAPPMHEVLQVPLKSGHKRVTDCLISLFSAPDFGSEIGVLHVCNRQIAKNLYFPTLTFCSKTPEKQGVFSHLKKHEKNIKKPLALKTRF